MRSLIRLLDRFLRWAQGVFEFWDDPDCMFRVGLARARHAIPLPDGEVPAGAKVLAVHFWNEHMPRIPPGGPDLAAAVRGRRMLDTSFRALGRELHHNPLLAGVQALGGGTVLVHTDAGPVNQEFFERLGFTIFPYHSPLGRFGEFWENLYSWGLMWTFNQVSLRQRHILRLHRSEMWMSRVEFMRRYGSSENTATPRLSANSSPPGSDESSEDPVVK